MPRSRITPILFALPLFLAGTALSAQQAPQDLSDAEVAHAAVTANAIDVELARLAQSRAVTQPVRAFARTMIADHSGVNGQAAALAEKLGVTPRDNAVSRSLQSGAEEARGRLEKKEDVSFDQAYIEREVTYHQAVLDALDGLLIPTTENAELRALLQKVRPVIAAHLARAKEVQGSLLSAR